MPRSGLDETLSVNLSREQNVPGQNLKTPAAHEKCGLGGVEVVKKAAIPSLFAHHDRILYW